MHKRRKRSKVKRFIRKHKKLLILIGVVVLIVCLLGAVSIIDKNYRSADVSNADGKENDPQIEVLSLGDEVSIVGEGIDTWLDSYITAGKFFRENSIGEDLYTAESPRLQYTISNLPSDIEVVKQVVKLSQNKNMIDSKVYSLDKDDREVTFDYLYVDTTYYYEIDVSLSNGRELLADGSFNTKNTPRVLEVDGVWNFRDIGGTRTISDNRINQGLIYRGTELDGANEKKFAITQTGVSVMLEEFGIKTELDLRADVYVHRTNKLGEAVSHKLLGFNMYKDIFTSDGEKACREAFKELANEENYPIYVHCTYGKDRTGTLCYLLDLLLGVSEERSYKNWELSALTDGALNYTPMNHFMDELDAFSGATMQEKVENYLLSIGVTNNEIDSIRNILLED